MSRKDQLTDYVEAIDAEKAAWLAVKDCRPGTASFRIDLWLRWRLATRWRNAVGQTNWLLERLSRKALPPDYESNCPPRSKPLPTKR